MPGNVILPADVGVNAGKAVACNTVARDSTTEYMQLMNIADPSSASCAAVTAPGVGGANALAIQGVSNGIAVPVSLAANPAAQTGTVWAVGTSFPLGTTTSNLITVPNARILTIFLVPTANSGTSPTLSLALYPADPLTGDVSGAAIASMASTLVAASTLNVAYVLQVGAGLVNTASTNNLNVVGVDFGTQFRIVATVGGSATPTFTASVSYVAK